MPPFEATQAAFARHLRDPAQAAMPAGLEERRVQIYRDLLFNNVAGLLAGNFPVIRRLLDAQEWQQLVRAFYASHACHTPLFYEIGSEFVRFLGEQPQHWAEKRPFLHELAHYEWVELALDLAEGEAPPSMGEVPQALLDLALQPSPLAWLLGYRFAVHQIRPDHQPTAAPAQPSWILVWRNAEDRVQFQHLEGLAARLLALIQAQPGHSARTALQQLASEIQHPQPESLLEPATALVRSWLARGVLGLGG